ncbi:MAG: valine--tRNA ligase [Candidatus Micrarchaeia archaeon]
MYDNKVVEEKWLKYWKDNNIFKFDEKSKKPIYIIDTPPPFTNGALHMGQVFWISYIDTIARYKMMAGYNVIYPIGWDMHGFPTEIAVEKKYGKSLSREEFYQKALELSNSNIEIMRNMVVKLGSVFDEKFEYKTASEEYTKKVQLALLEMYKKGRIVRDIHPVLWCTSCNTSISREEVEEVQKETTFNYIKFDIVKADKGEATNKNNKNSKSKKDNNSIVDNITIATTRPELIHACVAIAVNDSDDRFKNLIGKEAIVPIFNKKVKIIGDPSINKELGTGCEMICTFGDSKDVMMYHKYKLDLVDAIDETGKLKNADKFTGMNIKDARAAILDELNKQGYLKKQEKLIHSVKVHDRCGTDAEFMQHTQWFIKIKDIKEKIKESANEIKWVPEQNKQKIFDWIEGIEWDWNISRSRIFGTPIPFGYCEKCGEIAAPKVEDLPINPSSNPISGKCKKCGGNIVMDSYTCDGWVDSCITPLVVAGWPDKKLMKARFPVDVRIQGVDIIRTWAFFTIVGALTVADDKPFETILTHGMILGTDGREMHKRWGNGIFPEDIIAKYSIDAIRLWAALSGGLNKDKIFSYKEMDYASSFITKLYNSALFIKNASDEFGVLDRKEPKKDMNIFDMWILNKFNKIVKDVRAAYDNLMLFEALSKLVNFYWHEFCDYYIEDVKHRVYSKDEKMKGSKEAAIYTLNYILQNSLILLAPNIPFVAEEINSMFCNESIFKEKLPAFVEMPSEPSFVMNGLLFSANLEEDPEIYGEMLNAIIVEARKQKAKLKIALNKQIKSININVPVEYYNAISANTEDIKGIIKADNIKLTEGKELSVSIEV